MSAKIEWVAVRKFRPEPIGAVGFIGNDIAAIVAFYDDADGNQDGRVSAAEWLASKALFNLQGKAVTEVAMQARVDPDILLRDASIHRIAAELFTSFAANLIEQGIYKVYFSRGVSLAGSAVAKTITDSMVKQFVIRKGFETAVKNAILSL